MLYQLNPIFFENSNFENRFIFPLQTNKTKKHKITEVHCEMFLKIYLQFQ